MPLIQPASSLPRVASAPPKRSVRGGRLRRLGVPTVTVLLAAALPSWVPAEAAVPAPAAGTPTMTASPTETPREVTLPTGDRVVVAPYGAGGPPYELHPADRGGAVVGFEIARFGDDVYVIPGDAERVGATLDREAYNVTALAGLSRPGSPLDSITSGLGSVDESAATYDLDVQVLDAAGEPWAGGAVEVFNTQNFTDGYFPEESLDAQGRVTLEVQAGSFSVSARVRLPGGGVAVVADPQVRVSGHTAVVLDARDAQPLSVEIDGVDSTLEQVEVAYGISDEHGRSNLWFLPVTAAQVEAGRVRVQPTEVSARGEFALTSHWRREADASGELYDLVFESTAVPNPPHYVQDPDDPALARFDAIYRGPGERVQLPSARGWYTDRTGTALIGLHPLGVPTRRAELATASPSVNWYACMYPDRKTETRVCEEPQPYEPGPATAHWLDLLHPSLDQVLRIDENWLWVFAGLADAQHTGALSYESFEQARMVVRRNGAEIWTGSDMFGYVPVPSGRGRFTIDYDVVLTGDAVPTAHRSHTRWRFRSGSPGDPTGAEPPILVVGYRPDTNELGIARPDRRLPITVDVRSEGDATGTPVVEKSRSRVSPDGGETWHRRRLSPTDVAGAYELVVPPRYLEPGGSLSLRVRVVAADHTAISQRLIDAIDVAP